MTLYCIQSFRQSEWDVKAGETIEVNPVVGGWMLDSFPAYFRKAETAQADTTPITEAPPVDKQVKRAAKTK